MFLFLFRFGILNLWFKDTHAFHLEVETAESEAGTISAYERCREACSGRRVLIAEDDEFTRSALNTVLTDAGMAVTTSKDGEEAVALARQSQQADKPFDIIIMDSLMPKLNGADTCIAIRKWEKESGIKKTPILGFSATVQGEADCRAAGMDAFVTKIQRTPILQTLAHTLGLVEMAPPSASATAANSIDVTIGMANFGEQAEFYRALEVRCS